MNVLEVRPSSQLSGRGRQMPVSLSPALSTYLVPGQLGPHNKEILWRKKGAETRRNKADNFREQRQTLPAPLSTGTRTRLIEDSQVWVLPTNQQAFIKHQHEFLPRAVRQQSWWNDDLHHCREPWVPTLG